MSHQDKRIILFNTNVNKNFARIYSIVPLLHAFFPLLLPLSVTRSVIPGLSPSSVSSSRVGSGHLMLCSRLYC